MSTDDHDPLFESLDRLAGLADHDATGDRMPDIRRRVRVARRRRVAAVGVAAAAVLAAGVGLSQLGSTPDEVQPAPPTGDLRQSVSVTAQARFADLIEISVSLEGRSSAYTDATTGEAVPAGPLRLQVVVDGTVVEETRAADVTCEPGGEVTTYTARYPENLRRSLTAAVDGPGEHVVEVRAPYCADGELIDEPTRTTVVTELGPRVVVEERTADVDGDGADDVVRITAPAPGDPGDRVLEVELADGTTTSQVLAEAAESALEGLPDLDGDGIPEIVVIASAGESTAYDVFQVAGAELRRIPTKTEAGADEPLAFGVSESGPQDVTPLIELTDDGFVSYRYLDPAPVRPAPVEVRRWVLADGVLVLQDATEPGCVDADFALRLGSC